MFSIRVPPDCSLATWGRVEVRGCRFGSIGGQLLGGTGIQTVHEGWRVIRLFRVGSHTGLG